MSVRRGREGLDLPYKRTSVEETSRKSRTDGTKNRESLPAKSSRQQPKVTSSRDGSRSEKTATGGKSQVRKIENAVGRNRKTPENANKSDRTEQRRPTKTEVIYLKDVLEKKITNREDGRKVGGTGQKPTKPEEKLSHVQATEKNEEKPKMKRDRTRTRTLSPTEVKQLLPHKMAGGDQTRDEEGTTAVAKVCDMKQIGGGDEEYENDFEDYESDFEEDESASNSTDKSELAKAEDDVITESDDQSEVSQDQLQVELSEIKDEETQETSIKARRLNDERCPKPSEPPWRTSIQKRHMEDIRKSVERENIKLSERRNSTTSSVNESKIDFSMASARKEKEKEAAVAAAAKRRGQELLNMITLDTITYTIMEIPPIPYESYMKTFGKSNSKQVHVQTNEDDLDEETQTDRIETANKWTQNPPEYLDSRKNLTDVSYVLSKEERLGVGGDRPTESENEEFGKEMIGQSKTKGLLTFLSWSSQVVLTALERKSGNFLNLEKMPNSSKDIAFGDGYVRLQVDDVAVLKARSVTLMCLSNRTYRKLLTVHLEKNKFFQRSYLCVWSLRELSKPLEILVATNRVTSCCFGSNQGTLVFSGLSDGSVCLWDLRESPAYYHGQPANDSKWIFQSPTYTTAANLDENLLSTIVAINVLSKTDGNENNDDFTPLQVCTLDRNGTVTIWSVVQTGKSQRNEPLEDLGLAYWGRLKLLKSSSFCIFDNLRDEFPGLYITCNDMLINDVEDDGLYIANSLGSIHHSSTYGSSMKPRFYVPSKKDAVIETTCLEMCPFDGNYFLAGCGDGSIRLHSRHQESPLITLRSQIINDEKPGSVTSISWMSVRPCVFFALDSRSRIHIWDLGVSDMYPDMTLVLTHKKIISMKLLDDSNPKQVPFIVIGTADGHLEIHRLNKTYGSRSDSDVRNEKKMFLKYVSIL